MKQQRRAGTLLQGPELSRMQRKFKGKVKWIRTFDDGAYLVLFMDDAKLYRPSQTWLKMHSQWAEKKRKKNQFVGKQMSILWHDSVEKIEINHQTGAYNPATQKVEVISQHTEQIPLPIWKGVTKFWDHVLFPHIKPGNN